MMADAKTVSLYDFFRSIYLSETKTEPKSGPELSQSDIEQSLQDLYRPRTVSKETTQRMYGAEVWATSWQPGQVLPVPKGWVDTATAAVPEGKPMDSALREVWDFFEDHGPQQVSTSGADTLKRYSTLIKNLMDKKKATP